MEPRIQYAKTKDGVSIAYWTLGDGMPFVQMPAGPVSHIQLEWQWPDGLASRFILGGEAGIVLGQFGVVGRLAYGSRPDPASTLPQVTYGVTLEMRWVDFDFATESNDRQDFITRRVGLRFAF